MASSMLKFGRVIGKNAILARLMTISGKQLQQGQLHTCLPCRAASEILMPSLSPTMTEGTIVKWYKKEGDIINAGDVLCDVQTDKAVVSFDTEEEGILAKILKAENSTDVKIGTLIAVMVEEGDDWQNVEIPEQSETPTDTAPSEPAPTQPVSQQVSQPSSDSAPRSAADLGNLHGHGIGPSVRKLAEEYGVNVDSVSGSGPYNRITKSDVMNIIKSQGLHKQDLSAQVSGETTPTSISAPVSSTSSYVPSMIPELDGEEFIDIPNTGMRTTIAKRLTLSKTTIPHSYVTMNCNVGPVTKLRKQLKNENMKVSVNDFIIKSAALALQRVPQVNSVWQNDEATSMLNVDISVAVATDSGLITPIVKNTPQLAVDEISSTVRDLAERARENKLQLHEFQGGTFTISNLGMFGISEFSAVINPPQTAIMAVGSSRVALGQDGKPESQMTVTLSYDARVIDETDASQFLEVFKDVMENPQLMLSGRSASKRSNPLM
ncbi:hypothetical protein ACF0H5_016303 [Mactra antiquata]